MKRIEHTALVALLSYDKGSGIFRWREDRNSRTRAGDIAGCTYRSRGGAYPYVVLGIGYHRYRVSHLAWFYVTGEWPTMQIDHMDGDPTNNAFSNLRLATPQQNQANRRAQRNNLLGVKGVQIIGNRFRARIRVNGKSIHLGLCGTIDEAAQLYQAAAKKYFGAFARAR